MASGTEAQWKECEPSILKTFWLCWKLVYFWDEPYGKNTKSKCPVLVVLAQRLNRVLNPDEWNFQTCLGRYQDDQDQDQILYKYLELLQFETYAWEVRTFVLKTIQEQAVGQKMSSLQIYLKEEIKENLSIMSLDDGKFSTGTVFFWIFQLNQLLDLKLIDLEWEVYWSGWIKKLSSLPLTTYKESLQEIFSYFLKHALVPALKNKLSEDPQSDFHPLPPDPLSLSTTPAEKPDPLVQDLVQFHCYPFEMIHFSHLLLDALYDTNETIEKDFLHWHRAYSTQIKKELDIPWNYAQDRWRKTCSIWMKTFVNDFLLEKCPRFPALITLPLEPSSPSPSGKKRKSPPSSPLNKTKVVKRGKNKRNSFWIEELRAHYLKPKHGDYLQASDRVLIFQEKGSKRASINSFIQKLIDFFYDWSCAGTGIDKVRPTYLSESALNSMFENDRNKSIQKRKAIYWETFSKWESELNSKTFFNAVFLYLKRQGAPIVFNGFLGECTLPKPEAKYLVFSFSNGEQLLSIVDQSRLFSAQATLFYDRWETSFKKENKAKASDWKAISNLAKKILSVYPLDTLLFDEEISAHQVLKKVPGTKKNSLNHCEKILESWKQLNSET